MIVTFTVWEVLRDTEGKTPPELAELAAAVVAEITARTGLNVQLETIETRDF